LRSQLLEAERLLESSISAPLALQPLLRRTSELEMSYISQQRMECIAEMREAIEHIDKLRRKQSSIVSSIKLATGASAGTDHIDSRIFSLKARMEKIALAMNECHQRWVEIESLCGFPIVTSPTDITAGQATSIASSSTSESSPAVVTGGGCTCAHESFISATTARNVTSGHPQKRIYENATRPVRFIAAEDEQMRRSASSDRTPCLNTLSGKKMKKGREGEEKGKQALQLVATFHALSQRLHNFRIKQDLRLFKRSVSNTLLGLSQSNSNENDDGDDADALAGNKRQKLPNGLIFGGNKKRKLTGLFRKITKS
uniref:SOAR domain-containing protein n=1 Tax=Gongylonema pulchrum TaxID=637853 RepID=A0A183E6Y5_9BILA